MAVPNQTNPTYAKDLAYDRNPSETSLTDPKNTPRNSSKTLLTSNSTEDNMPETGKELVRRPNKDDDNYASSFDSEADRRDQMIRQAPYLPQIQVWARKDGPYTLKIGHQWFHCDDLIINDQEYRQQNKPSTRYQPQQISSKDQTSNSTSRPSRPQAGRTASQQMMQSAKSARDTEERRRRREDEKSAAPLPREPERRRGSVSKPKEEDDYFRDRERDRQPDRDRRGSITTNHAQWPEPRRSDDSITPAVVPPSKSRPQMPRRISRRSTQDGAILIPVRSKGKRVRFAPNI